MNSATKPSLPSIKFLLEPQQNGSHSPNGNAGLTAALKPTGKALIDVTKTDIAQYHFPSTNSSMTQRKDPRQLPHMPPGTLPAIQNDIHSHPTNAPSHGLPPHGHTRSYSDSTAPFRQPLDFESMHTSHAYSNHFATSPSTASPSYLSPHQNQYSYGNNPQHYHQYPVSRQNLSPPLPTPPHGGTRARPPHNHSRSMSDYTHPYASSLPNDATYLTPVHHEPLREKNHRFTPSHRRTGSASTIDYMLNNTHISPAPAQAPRAPEPPRYTSPIPPAPASSSNGATSQDDDPEMDESSSVEGGTHSDRSESPSPSGKDAHGADQNRYVCPFCSKRFSRPSSLRIHTYSHTGEKPFVCTEEGCGRKFSVQSNMRRHLRVHRMGRTVKKVRYDGEVEGVRGNSCDNGPGHTRENSGGSLDTAGGRDREDGGLHRSGTV